jgi:hypothetical protein
MYEKLRANPWKRYGIENKEVSMQTATIPINTETSFAAIFKHFYKASGKEVAFVDVPVMNFLMIDGHGDPNTSQSYKDAVEALYAVSYALKFDLKKQGLDYKVGPLEGLWWSEDMGKFSLDKKGDWLWTMMIAQPDEVTPEKLSEIITLVRQKKTLPALDKIRLAKMKEGNAAQIMHLGPYSSEGPTIQKLHDWIFKHGYHFDGREQKHHEIYFGDPRRMAPENLKTILRQPFVKVT